MKFLSLETILEIHERNIKMFGGSFGLRDEHLLQSAISNPQNLHFYNNADVYEVAVSYCISIIKNHAFIDGNKRAGFAAMMIFLTKNDILIDFDALNASEAVQKMVDVATSKVNLKELSSWLRNLKHL